MELTKKGVPIKNIDIVKDMYAGVATNVRTCNNLTNDTIGLYQGSSLSPFLFTIAIDEVTKII